jgi:hypothetical protein
MQRAGIHYTAREKEYERRAKTLHKVFTLFRQSGI